MHKAIKQKTRHKQLQCIFVMYRGCFNRYKCIVIIDRGIQSIVILFRERYVLATYCLLLKLQCSKAPVVDSTVQYRTIQMQR